MKLNSALGQGLLYGFSIVLMKSISLWMLPIMTHYLSQDEFGQLEIITTIAALGSVFVGLGLEGALYRYAGMAAQKERRKIAAYIYTLTLIAALVTLLLTQPLVSLLTPYLPDYIAPIHVQLICYMLAFESAIAIPLGWLRMQNRPLIFFFATTGRTALQASLVWFALFQGEGVTGVLYATSFTAALQALVLAVIQLRMTGLGFSLTHSKQVLYYGLPLVLSGVVAFALNGADRWLLAEHASLEQVAHYAVAAKFALMVVILMQPFGMWWSPKRFENLATQAGRQQTSQTISLGIVLIFCAALLITGFIPSVMGLLLPASYSPAALYALGLILAYMLKELTELTSLGSLTGDSTKRQFAINSVTGIVGLALMQVFTPSLGVWGPILALIVAQTLRVCAFYHYSQRQLPLPYPLSALTQIFVLTLLWLAGFAVLELGFFEPLLVLLAMGSVLGLAQRTHLIQWHFLRNSLKRPNTEPSQP